MKPLTSHQLDLLIYFGTGRDLSGRPARMATYTNLIARGLLETCEQWPFHRPTEDGAALLRRYGFEPDPDPFAAVRNAVREATK